MWVGAMHKYHFVAKGVAPKRERLRIASEELAETQRILAAAKARLAEVEEGIATLQAKYDDCVRKKDELEQKCSECEGRLIRADKVCGLEFLSFDVTEIDFRNFVGWGLGCWRGKWGALGFCKFRFTLKHMVW